MKTLKTVILIFSMMLTSFTFLNAADYDCGCSTLTSNGWISSGYYSNNGDCCEQVGQAEVIVYNDEGSVIVTYETWQDVTYKCYGC